MSKTVGTRKFEGKAESPQRERAASNGQSQKREKMESATVAKGLKQEKIEGNKSAGGEDENASGGGGKTYWGFSSYVETDERGLGRV